MGRVTKLALGTVSLISLIAVLNLSLGSPYVGWVYQTSETLPSDSKNISIWQITNEQHSRRSRVGEHDGKEEHDEIEEDVCATHSIHNFFTDMKARFSDMLPLSDCDIDINEFLRSAVECEKTLDVLSKVAFKPVKQDYSQNVKIIQKGLEKVGNDRVTMEDIVTQDIRHGIQTDDGSTTNSIVWLTRSLMFLSVLMESMNEQETFASAVDVAYESTIKQYHSFYVKALFKVVRPLLPDKRDAERSMALVESVSVSEAQRECLYHSMNQYNDGLRRVCAAISTCLKSKDIIVLHRHG